MFIIETYTLNVVCEERSQCEAKKETPFSG